MISAPRIGILGGYGSVGRSVARQLQTWCGVTIGGRNAGLGRDFAATLSCEANWQAVDAHDERSLASFCIGCAVVVNCAGPASVIGEKVGRAAFAAGAHYIETSVSAGWQLPTCGRTALLAAGMYPGLSGLLPRFLARQGFDRISGLTAYVGGCDRLSSIAALDYLDSLSNGFGEANAAWHGGKRVSRAVSGGERKNVPFFPRPVVLKPYLTAEAERLARSLQLSELRWYSVFDGEHVVGVLPLAVSRQDAKSLVRAAEMDSFGREPYQIMLFEMAGMLANVPVSRSLLLKASGGAELTGIAAAAGVSAVVTGGVPDGVHEFAEVMDAAKVVECLRRADSVLTLELFEDSMTGVEQGEL